MHIDWREVGATVAGLNRDKPDVVVRLVKELLELCPDLDRHKLLEGMRRASDEDKAEVINLLGFH